MDRNSIKLRIREILALKGMTNRALADKIQVSPQYVSNILNGSALSLNALCKIADDVSYKHLRAHETLMNLEWRLLLEKK